MGVNLSKTSNVLFFAGFLPALSFAIAWGFFTLFPSIPFWVENISPIFAYGFLYSIFEKYLWHWEIFHLLGIVDVPDLRGRWKGLQRSSYKENGKNVEVPTYMEIVQTFSSIFISSYYERSESDSIVANFARIHDDIYLFFTYDSLPNSLKNGTMEAHKGTAKLKHLPSENKIIGFYFNSVGNHGEIHFSFEGRDLLYRFSQ